MLFDLFFSFIILLPGLWIIYMFIDTDMTRLTVANRAERGGSPVCTHGSLNTEEDEEEKEHRRETSHGSPEALLQQLPDGIGG